jgi:hypothetical protein
MPEIGAAVGFETALRFVPFLSLVVGLDVTPLDASVDFDGVQAEASTVYVDVVATIRWNFLGGGFWDPWVAGGAGWAIWTGFAGADIPSLPGSFDAKAFVADTGLDLHVAETVALGIRADFRPLWWLATDPRDSLGRAQPLPAMFWSVRFGATFNLVPGWGA